MMIVKLRRKNNITIASYTLTFLGHLIAIILIIVFVILPRTPKFLVHSMTFDTLEVGTASNASFNMQFDIQFRIKNKNFGKFEYDYSSSVDYYYRGIKLTNVFIASGDVRVRSTVKIDMSYVNMDSSRLGKIANSSLSTDIENGILPLTALSKLDGEVKVTKIEKHKSSVMHCKLSSPNLFRI